MALDRRAAPSSSKRMSKLLAKAAAAATLAVLITCPWSHWLLEDPMPLRCEPDDAVVVITGISSGLGRDMAKQLASAGYHVIGTVRSTDGVSEPRISPVICDVTDPDGVARVAAAVAAARANGKRLLGLVNNAGISARTPLQAWESGSVVALIEQVFAVNVGGLARMTAALLPALREDAAAGAGCGSARVLNVGSLAGFVARAEDATYAASKAAVERASDALRRLLRPERVWVAVLEPGFVASRMCSAAACQQHQPSRTTTPAAVHALTSARPLPRYAVAGAVGLPADAIVALCSHLPDAVTDAIYRVLGPT